MKTRKEVVRLIADKIVEHENDIAEGLSILYGDPDAHSATERALMADAAAKMYALGCIGGIEIAHAHPDAAGVDVFGEDE